MMLQEFILKLREKLEKNQAIKKHNRDFVTLAISQTAHDMGTHNISPGVCEFVAT